MSDWTMQARNTIEEHLQAIGYRVMYDYTCRYTTYAPQPNNLGLQLWASRKTDYVKDGLGTLDIEWERAR
jgi:hypothetical protein